MRFLVLSLKCSHSLFLGHFGTGIQSYFNFLRFLVLMNFVASLLVVGFVIAPNAAFEALHLSWTSQLNGSLGEPVNKNRYK